MYLWKEFFVKLNVILASLCEMTNRIMTENELSNIIIGKAIEVHRQLGPGLLESAYHKCLIYELKNKGLKLKAKNN